MSAVQCGECDAYHPLSHGEKAEGECRARPPQIFLVPVQTIQGNGMAFTSRFPGVAAAAWCAEFDDGGAPSDGKAIIEETH